MANKLVQVPLSDASEIVEGAILNALEKGKSAKPIMIHGSPGIGKSSIIHQLEERLKPVFEKKYPGKTFRIWDVRVGAMMDSDIQGIPFPGPENESGERDMLFSTPTFFPKENEVGILFLDEISNASVANQQACYRLVLDRSIHNGKKMNEGVIIIGAGNLKEDKTGAKGLIPALASRFGTHLYIKPNVDDFVGFCLKAGFDHRVAAYVSFAGQPALFSPMKADEFGFPCPRNWEAVSDMMQNELVSEENRKNYIIGSVGISTATEFYGYLENYKYTPDFEKVEKTGEYTLPKECGNDRGIRFAIVMATAFRIIGIIGDHRNLPEADMVRVNNLAAILEAFDPSIYGIALRAMKNQKPVFIAMIAKEKGLIRMKKLLEKVLTLTRQIK